MKKVQYGAAPGDEKEDDNKTREFPEIDHIGLSTVGIFCFLSMPLILSASRSMSYAFTTGSVSYRCLVPECEDPANATFNTSWLQKAVPFTDGEPATCKRFTVRNSTDSCSANLFFNQTENCNAWVYDPEAERTILNEWDLTCDHNLWKLTLPGTMNQIGQFVGLLVTGYLSDRYGRRNILVVCTTMSSILGLCRSFSVNYEMFVTFEFLDAMSGSAVYSAAIVLGRRMEFVGPRNRVKASIIIGCLYVVALMGLGLCAMLVRSWRILLRIYYTPGFLVLFMPFLVPESVRWLQNKGRLEEAESVLRQIAARNKVPVSEDSIRMIRNSRQENLNEDTSSPPSISPVKEIIGNRRILIRLLLCAFCWIVGAFIFYGLSLRSVAVPGDKYINFILVASVEIPSHFASWILSDYLGRKPTLCIAYLLSGFFCIVTIFIPPGWWHFPLIVFVVGKFCISTAYNLIYIYTVEMFPTQLRHSLLTFCSMIGRTGSMIAPQMPLLATYMPSLPLVLFGVMGLLASLVTLNFPETRGVKLPDTVSEAEQIGQVKKEKKSSAA